MSENITRIAAAEPFGDVLRGTQGLIMITGTLDSSQRDSGNDPTTRIRAGNVLAKLTSGKLVLLGYGCPLRENESVGTGDGSTRLFALDRKYVVPYSETIMVGDTEMTNGVDYILHAKAGYIEFFTPPDDGEAITATYYHAPYDDTYGTYTVDGRTTPYGILADTVDMLNENHEAVDRGVKIIVGGWVKEDKIITQHPRLLSWAKHWLGLHGIIGLSDPAA